MKHLVVILALLFFSGSASLAAEGPLQFTHANFVVGEKSMQNLIEFPDIVSDVDVTITCTAHATAKGRLKNARCSSPTDPDLKFTMAVSRKFRSARVTPATVNGKREEVDFQFSVVFKKKGESETIKVYPHNMKNVDRLGLDYIGAQRYSVHPWPNRCVDFTRDDLIMEVAIINELGVARDFDVMAANFGMSVACKDGFAAHLENGKWIPALHNGKFIESVWANPRINMRSTFKRQR
jgi:hypothetical protein